MTKAFSVAVEKTASWMGVKGKRFKKVVAEAVSGSSKVSSTARRLKRYVEKSCEVPEEVIKDAISSVAEKENKLQSSLDVAVQKLDTAEQKAKLALQQKKLKTAEYEVKLKLLYKAEVEVTRKELYTLKNRKSNLDCGLRARACDETDVKFLNASHYIPERLYGKATEDSVAYALVMGSTWFLVGSWLFDEFFFNPSGFDWQKIVDDWDDWNKWISS